MSNQPVRGNEYTMAEIDNLELKDSPFLLFKDCGLTLNIQGEGCPFPEMKWRYAMTTHEWIPLFYAVDNKEVAEKILAYREYGEIYFGWDVPEVGEAISYLEAIQELEAERENNKYS